MLKLGVKEKFEMKEWHYMFNKVPSGSPNLTEENIEALKQLFPETVTDGGKINFDKLKVLLGESVDTGREKYEFTWPGKQKMRQSLQVPSKATLKVDEQSSKNMLETKNIFIEGDNLLILKALQKSYYNKIKVIYIDPPYNTGKDFIYPDNFDMDLDEYLKLTKQLDHLGTKMNTEVEASGRRHTKWLNMMYSRLCLSRYLLQDDGVIFVSINDIELANLKKIMNSIFGEDNFIAQLVINTGANQSGEGVKIQTNTEYVLVYSKTESANIYKIDKVQGDLRALNDAPTPLETRLNMGYTIYYNPKTKEVIPDYDYDKNRVELNKEELVYTDNDQLIKKGFIPIRPGMRNKKLHRWRWSLDRVKEEKDNLVFKKTSKGYKVYFKQEGYNSPKNLMNFRSGTSELKKLFDERKIFDFPKSVEFIKRLINLSSKDGIILDFFSGSATTAHAVMKLNAEDGGNRQFIMVQLPEPTDEKSEAYKAGYKNICEIGKERIRRAGEQILEEHPEAADRLDVGFKVLKLDSSNIREWNVEFDQLEDEIDLFADTFVDGAREIDIVHEIMLKTGLELTLPIDTFEVDGKNVYDIAYGNLFICLADEINETVVRAIIERRRTYDIETSTVVLKDTGFANNDSEKLNCFELLKDAGYQDDQLMTI